MALVLTDVGAVALLDIIFNDTRATAGDNITMKLFVNDVTPARSGVSYTEAVGGGYVDIDLTIAAASWTTADNSPPDAIYAQQTYTFIGALDSPNTTIYGYYMVDADGTVLWAEKLTAPFTPANNGDTLKITPKFQMSSGTPT